MSAHFLIVGSTLIILVLTGCSRKETRESHDAGEHEAHAASGGVTFSAKHGLSVPPTTAKFIDLQIADVEERNVPASVRFMARVFQRVGERALASAFVMPRQAVMLTNGQTAVVAWNGVEGFKGIIAAVNRSLEKVQGQTEVMVSIEDGGPRLTNGVVASISVPLGNEQSVVTIPRSALLHTAEGDFVYTVSGEHFVRAALKTGEVGHETVEVTDGLYAGDRIVVQPVMTLWLAELQSIRGGKACADGH